MTHRIYSMSFASVFQALVTKAERKGRTKEEVADLTAWLTGYDPSAILALLADDEGLTYGDFFLKAPRLAADRIHITGKICGVQIETLDAPLMQDIRRLDKLIDRLAKGKPVSDIIAKYSTANLD